MVTASFKTLFASKLVFVVVIVVIVIAVCVLSHFDDIVQMLTLGCGCTGGEMVRRVMASCGLRVIYFETLVVDFHLVCLFVCLCVCMCVCVSVCLCVCCVIK